MTFILTITIRKTLNKTKVSNSSKIHWGTEITRQAAALKTGESVSGCRDHCLLRAESPGLEPRWVGILYTTTDKFLHVQCGSAPGKFQGPHTFVSVTSRSPPGTHSEDWRKISSFSWQGQGKRSHSENRLLLSAMEEIRGMLNSRQKEADQGASSTEASAERLSLSWELRGALGLERGEGETMELV